MTTTYHLYLTNAEALLAYPDWTEPNLYIVRPEPDRKPTERFTDGWVYLRDIEIPDLLMPSRAELVVTTVASLRNQIERKRAETESECRKVEEQIQNLLAIGYDQPTTPAEVVDVPEDDIPF